MSDQNIDPIDALTDAGLKPIIIDEHTDFDALPKFNAFTICDVLIHLRPDLAEASAISGAEFEKAGLPMFGGCSVCGASIAAHNACPGKSGFLVGTCCATPENVYATVEEFLASRPAPRTRSALCEEPDNSILVEHREAARAALGSLTHTEPVAPPAAETNPAWTWTCDVCGSANVQGTAWIHLNSNTIVQGDPPDDDYWCEDCEDHVTVSCGPRKPQDQTTAT